MKVLYLSTLAVGVLGTTIAIAMINVRSALDTWWTLAGIFGGGMLGLFLLGFLSRAAGKAAGLIAAGVGVLVIMWMSLSPNWGGSLAAYANPFHGSLTNVFGTAALLLTGLLATLLLSRNTPKNSS